MTDRNARQGAAPVPELDAAAQGELINFAQDIQSALGKLKTADETGTNALLRPNEVGALLTYLQAAAEQWKAIFGSPS